MRTLTAAQIRAAQESFKHLHAFINRCPESASSSLTAAATSSRSDDVQSQVTSSGPLAGLQIAVKDNICTRDLPTTCASRALEGYRSAFDATVVELVKNAGAAVTGKTNLDEFGMGSHSLHSHYGAVSNPFCERRSAGGSSGGSAVAVATSQCHAALGTDTGGSVRLPAAYTGIYGFKPSYGRLSRWGVVAYANSLDTVGVMADDLAMVRRIYNALDVHDAKDPTSITPTIRSRLAAVSSARSPLQSLRIGVPEEYRVEELSSVVRRAWSKTLTYLQSLGHTIHQISLSRTEQALPAYYILAPAEASSNLAKYDGVRYGSRVDGSSDPLYASTRQQVFGEEVRRRILLGAFSLSAGAIDNYFLQAQKIRRLVQDDFNGIFALQNVLLDFDPASVQREHSIDAIVVPTSIDIPPLLEEIKSRTPQEMYAGDVLTVPASLAGLPALNVPIKIDELPKGYNGPDSVGIQIVTQYGDDDAALLLGEQLQPLRHQALESALRST